MRGTAVADPIAEVELDAPEGAYEMVSPTAEGGQNDQSLIEELRLGTEAAYEALIQRFQQPVYSLVFRLLSDSADASDVVQEVFLKVFRNIGSFRGQSSLKTWIYRIAVNEAYNHRRWFARHRRQEVGLEADPEDGRTYQETLPDPARTPFEVVLGLEQQALVVAALNHLNPTFRTSVVLRDIEDMSYEEIAEILQISLGTVKSRILRGRESLRKSLAGRLEPGAAFQWTPQPVE
jgi:RNA polymerase sigma-70 factor, ECF subfamily